MPGPGNWDPVSPSGGFNSLKRNLPAIGFVRFSGTYLIGLLEGGKDI